MAEWGAWSNCSQPCNGGQRIRQRSVTRPSFGAGLPCGSLQDMQACNVRQCDDGCTYSKWTPWQPCSKACGGGMRTKIRDLIQAESMGGMACPRQQFESEACQEKPCPALGQMRCGAYVDVVFLIDGSELMRSEDFTDQKLAVNGLLSMYGVANLAGVWDKAGKQVEVTQRGNQLVATMGNEHARGAINPVRMPQGDSTQVTWEWHGGTQSNAPVYEALSPPFDKWMDMTRQSTNETHPGPMLGAVLFGADTSTGSKVLSPLAPDASTVAAAVSAEPVGRAGLRIPAALAEAERLLLQGRKDAPSVVVLILQGDPDSPHLVAEKSLRLRELGVRVVVFAVGEIRSEQNFKNFCSKPWQDNLFQFEDFKKLQEAAPGLVKNVCPMHPETGISGWAIPREDVLSL